MEPTTFKLFYDGEMVGTLVFQPHEGVLGLRGVVTCMDVSVPSVQEGLRVLLRQNPAGVRLWTGTVPRYLWHRLDGVLGALTAYSKQDASFSFSPTEIDHSRFDRWAEGKIL